MMAYFLLIGRHKLILSPEEEFALTKGESEYKSLLTRSGSARRCALPFPSSLKVFSHGRSQDQERRRCGGLCAQPRSALREGRHLRCRRHHARQVHGPRQVRIRPREGLRLLRRGAGLGFQRPALRQHHAHRLAHRLSGRRRCACCPRPCGSSRSRTTCRSSSPSSTAMRRRPARAACCGACSKKAEDMGFAVSAAAEFEFFLFEETPHSVREKSYRDLKTITPGFFGYSMLRSGVHADFYHELLDLAQQDGFRDRGPAHRDRPRRARGRDPRRRRAEGGRQGGAVQDLHQDPRPAPRLDGDLHGEMVARLARPVRPPAHVAARHQDRQGRVLRCERAA